MAGSRNNAISRSRAPRAALVAVLVALTAVAGWFVTPGGTAQGVSRSAVAGSIAKHADPVTSRASRGVVSTGVARGSQQVVAAQRAVAAGLTDAPLLPTVALVGTLVLVLASFTVRRGPGRTPSLAQGAITLRRGRAPPVTGPIPA